MRPFAALALASSLAAAQAPAPLAIARTDGTGPVAPGQTITIRVTSPGGMRFGSALLISEEAIGTHPVGAVPGEVRVTIPARTSLRRYQLTAMAGTAGQPVNSRSLEIDVERPDTPLSLWTQSPSLVFEAPGGRLPTLLVARFGDGSALDAGRSSRVTYTSSNEGVATVDDEGNISALKPGYATVTVRYKAGTGTVSLPIEVEVRVPAIEPSRYALVFAEQRVGTLSAPQLITLTNRTAGPVGIIDVQTTPYFTQTNDCPRARLPAGASCTISVFFKPVESGPAPGDLQISTTRSALPLTIRLKGTALPR